MKNSKLQPTARCLLIAILTMAAVSCSRIYYPEVLLKETRPLPLDTSLLHTLHTPQPYIITPGDRIRLIVSPNKGYNLIDIFSGRTATTQLPVNNTLEYTVELSGFVKLPIIDSLYVAGMTVSQLRDTLEVLYSRFFKDPFVWVEVTNRVAYVFKGNQGATVVPLTRENPTLIEVLAQAGGIPPGLKAYKIRLIRSAHGKPTAFNIDLSTMDNASLSYITINSGDIIYIEPVTRATSGILREWMPFVSLVSSFATVIASVVTLISLSRLSP